MLRVLVSSDNHLFAELLSEKLRARFGFSVGVSPARTDLRVGADLDGVQVVIVDATMAGAEELVQAVGGWAQIPVLVISLPRDEAVLVTFAEAGAAGLILRDANVADLGQAVHAALRGECSCVPWVAAVLLRRVARTGSVTGANASLPNDPLTAREKEIARLLAAGQSNKEIARTLSIGTPTAKNHVHNILRKLNVPSRAKAIVELQSLDRF